MIIDAFESMLSAPMGLLYMGILSSDGKRFSRKQSNWMTVILIGCLLMIDMAIVAKIGISVESKAKISVINIITASIFYMGLHKFRMDGKTLFSMLSAYLFIFIGDTLSDIYYGSAWVHFCVKIIIFLLIIVLVQNFFKKPFKEVFDDIHYGWWLVLMAFAMNGAFLSIIIFPGPLYMNPEMKLPAFFMCLVVLGTYIAFYKMFRHEKSQFEFRKSYQMLKLQTASWRKYMDTAEEIDRQRQIYCHDMRHYIAMLNICVQKGEWESVQPLIDGMSNNMELLNCRQKLRAYTGEPFIDAVLSFFAGKAEDMQMEFQICLEMPSNKKIDQMEFAVMLSNAIENGFNACKKMPNNHTRWVRLMGICKGQEYLMEVSNTFNNAILWDENHIPVSPDQGHGYGVQSIIDFVDRYNGFYAFSESEGQFSLKIIL